MRFSDQDYNGGRVYRLDRFVVPAEARDEFLMRVNQTHKILRKQWGFMQDFVLERPGEGGATIVQAAHREMGFSPKETIARLGITAEIGIYQAVGRRDFVPA